MDIDRIKSIVPIIVSITAVIISAVAFYVRTLSPADLTLLSGETLQIYHMRGELWIDIPVVLLKVGMQFTQPHTIYCVLGFFLCLHMFIDSLLKLMNIKIHVITC